MINILIIKHETIKKVLKKKQNNNYVKYSDFKKIL